MARILSALSLVTAVVTGLSGQDLVQLDPSTIRPGQALVVELTGNLLKDYLRCFNVAEHDVEGIAFCVFVQQRLDDGRFVIEHSKQIDSNGKPDRLVTFATTVHPTALARYHDRGVQLGALRPNLEPDESQPLVQAPNTAVLRLSGARSVEFRQWKLVK